MKKLLFNWSILTVSNIVYQLLIFTVLLKIAKILEPTQFGFFTIITTAVTIAQMFNSLGLQKVITREISRKTSSISEIARIAVAPTLIAFIICTFFLLIYLISIENISSPEILIFSCILLLGSTLWNYVEPLAFGIQEMNISAYLNVAGASALFLTIYLFPLREYSFKIIIAIYCSVFFVRSLLYLIIEWRKKYFSQKAEYSFDLNSKSLVKKSLPFYWNLLLVIPTVQLPILFLSQFSGQSEVGFFSISNKLAMPLNLVASSLFVAIFPVLSKLYFDNEEKFREKVKEIFEIMVICGIVVTLGIGLISKELIVFLLGKNYIPTIAVFTLQIWAALLLILLSFISVILSSTDNEKLLAKLSIFNAVLIGVFSFCGANFGALGLAISMWFGMLIGFVFHWYFIKTKIRIILTKGFVSMLYIFIIMSIITYLSKELNLIYRMGLFVILGSLVLIIFKNLLLDNFSNLYLGKKYFQ
jgi:O-antigen/teichoic acid export membrane protein